MVSGRNNLLHISNNGFEGAMQQAANQGSSGALTGQLGGTAQGNGIAGLAGYDYTQGYWYNGQWIPYYQQPLFLPYYYAPAPENHFVNVDKAENGFIVTKEGKKFIAKTPEDVAELLKDECKADVQK